jgi:hypothetical protein
MLGKVQQQTVNQRELFWSKVVLKRSRHTVKLPYSRFGTDVALNLLELALNVPTIYSLAASLFVLT